MSLDRKCPDCSTGILEFSPKLEPWWEDHWICNNEACYSTFPIWMHNVGK